jgi:hypothetical protein
VPRVDPAKAEVKTSTERKAILAEHPGIRAFVDKYAPLKGGLHIPKGLLATCEYLMAQHEREQAVLFMSHILEPKHLDETDQAYIFRTWFDALPPRRRTRKDNCRIADALTVAWNAFSQGQTITAIKIPHAPLAFI